MPESFDPAALLAALKADPTLADDPLPAGPPMSADIDKLEAEAEEVVQLSEEQQRQIAEEQAGKRPGTGPDDRGMTGPEMMRRAKALADEERRKERAAVEQVLQRWTVRAAGHRLLDRIDREAKEPGMPWPGCEPGWPRTDTDRKLGRLAPSKHATRRPWKELWEMLGPPRSDWLAILVGRTGRGKSGWALTVAEAVAASGAPVLILSCEMGVDELVARLLTIRADPFEPGSPRPPAWRDVLRGGVPPVDLAEALESACTACPNLYLWAPAHDQRTPEELAVMVHHVTRAHGRPPLVVLDYVQRLAFGEDRRAAVVELSGKLRDMTRPDPKARYPGCAMLVLSSTARSYYPLFSDAPSLLIAHRGGYHTEKSDPEKDPTWHGPDDLEGLGKESGELEYDASVVLCMTCDSKPDFTGSRPGIVVVAKNRAGNGDGWVPMNFDGPTGLWSIGDAKNRRRLEERAPEKRAPKVPKKPRSKGKATGTSSKPPKVEPVPDGML